MNALQVVTSLFRKDEFVDLLYWRKNVISERIMLLLLNDEKIKKYIEDNLYIDTKIYEESMKEIIADHKKEEKAKQRRLKRKNRGKKEDV